VGERPAKRKLPTQTVNVRLSAAVVGSTSESQAAEETTQEYRLDPTIPVQTSFGSQRGSAGRYRIEEKSSENISLVWH